jgi:hypothetical protein
MSADDGGEQLLFDRIRTRMSRASTAHPGQRAGSRSSDAGIRPGSSIACRHSAGESEELRTQATSHGLKHCYTAAESSRRPPRHSIQVMPVGIACTAQRHRGHPHSSAGAPLFASTAIQQFSCSPPATAYSCSSRGKPLATITFLRISWLPSPPLRPAPQRASRGRLHRESRDCACGSRPCDRGHTWSATTQPCRSWRSVRWCCRRRKRSAMHCPLCPWPS